MRDFSTHSTILKPTLRLEVELKIISALHRFLSSVKLAVVVIISLAAISAVGTIVEAKYDANTAQVLVYRSWYMVLAMGLLIVNLVFSAVDRLPWKKKHIGFVVAHAGIIILIFGSYITQKRGIDGTMIFDIGKSEKYVALPAHTDLAVYHTENGDLYTEIFKDEVEFLKNPPTQDDPLVIKTPKNDEIKIVDFWPYARREVDITQTSSLSDGPALRFQMKNAHVNVLEWVVQEGKESANFNFGPAQLVLTKNPKEKLPAGNALVIIPHSDKQKFNYIIVTASKGGVTKRGIAKAGDVIETGWMGLEFKALQYFPHAVRKNNYKKLERPNPLSTSALKVSFNGQEEMLGLNSLLKLFTQSTGYIMTFQNRRLDLGFQLKLDRFHVGRYPGTMMAQSYESEVSLEDGTSHIISMNEPLKHKGYTFYQASFQEDDKGQPVASILSVNRDPGRALKYGGAILILLGSIIMFYFKRYLAKTSAEGAAK